VTGPAARSAGPGPPGVPAAWRRSSGTCRRRWRRCSAPVRWRVTRVARRYFPRPRDHGWLEEEIRDDTAGRAAAAHVHPHRAFTTRVGGGVVNEARMTPVTTRGQTSRGAGSPSTPVTWTYYANPRLQGCPWCRRHSTSVRFTVSWRWYQQRHGGGSSDARPAGRELAGTRWCGMNVRNRTASQLTQRRRSPSRITRRPAPRAPSARGWSPASSGPRCTTPPPTRRSESRCGAPMRSRCAPGGVVTGSPPPARPWSPAGKVAPGHRVTRHRTGALHLLHLRRQVPRGSPPRLRYSRLVLARPSARRARSLTPARSGAGASSSRHSSACCSAWRTDRGKSRSSSRNSAARSSLASPR